MADSGPPPTTAALLRDPAPHRNRPPDRGWARRGRRSFRVLEPFVRCASTIAAWRILRWYDLALSRHVAPDGVASADAPFEPFLLHALLFSGNKIEKRVAGDVDELMRREEPFNLLAWPAADKGESVANRGVFGAPASLVERLRRGADISLAVDDDEPPARPQHANPLVHRPLRVRQCP